MIRTAKLFLYFTATALTAWLLPWFYHFVTDSSHNTPFTLYSCVTENFVSIGYSEEHGLRRQDASGKSYSDREFDSILPFFYYRQLLSDDRLPDTIAGVPVTPREIGLRNFMFRKNPSDLNKKKPALYPLLEAMSGRVDLAMPEDVFRINHRIEFVDMATNSVNEEKSERFTKALAAKGFEFPARYVEGNPTTHKEYDEGYFLLDKGGKLFHLKQLRGRPYVRHIPLPEGVVVGDIFITEFSDRAFYALLTDTGGGFYVMGNPGYELRKLPVENFNPRTEDIVVIGDMLHWTVKISGSAGERLYAVDARDYLLVDTLSYPSEESTGRKIGRWLFPFELKFTSYDDGYVFPRLKDFSWAALGVNAILAVVLLIIRRRRNRKALMGVAAGVLLFGSFLFIPLLFIRE